MELNQILKAVGKDQSYFTEEGLEYIVKLNDLKAVLQDKLSSQEINLLLEALEFPSSSIWLSDLLSYKE